MSRRRGRAVAGGLMVAVLTAAPAAAAPSLEASFGQVDGTQAEIVPDRPVVATAEPMRPCAAPVFGQPIDDVDPALLAETGWSHALSVAALVALSLAALIAPRRSWRTAPRRHGPANPEGWQD